MAEMISQGRVKSLFLPPDFNDTTRFTHRHTRAVFSMLLKACRDSDDPVVVYKERDSSKDNFLPAFDRFLASSGNADENIERVRIWEEYTAEHQLEYPPTRSSSGGDSR
ncbi:hypothetical protein JCM10296v2_003230 [Rhodotorula toruloides]